MMMQNRYMQWLVLASHTAVDVDNLSPPQLALGVPSPDISGGFRVFIWNRTGTNRHAAEQ